MKVKFGQKVFTIYRGAIIGQHVGFIGEDSFIVRNFSDEVMFDSLRWFYSDEGEKWFTTLQAAKDHLIEQNTPKYKKPVIKKYEPDYYELEEGIKK